MAKSEKERYTRIVRAKSFDSYPHFVLSVKTPMASRPRCRAALLYTYVKKNFAGGTDFE